MGCRPCKPPALKKIRQLMFISLIITILSLGLLLWARPFQNGKIHYVNSYQRAAAPLFREQTSVTQMCSAKPKARLQQKDSFVAVNLTKTVLLSAYLEHRLYSRKVRVVAVALRSETVDYRCVFYCQRTLHFSLGASSIHSDHFGFPYGTADIMCPVPSDCRTPSHIAVVSAADKSEDKRSFRFLEVKNRVMKKTSFDFNFAVCFSTMFDFTNVLQLVQSLEMLQLLGVNRVIIYKTSCSPETQRVLDYYTKTGLVEVIPWSFSRFLNVSRGWLPEHGPGDLHYFGQIPALNDCIYRYMYQSRHMALHDVDELILPQSVNSWLELLPYLEMKHGRDMCYMFENNVFPYNIILPPPDKQTPLQRDPWENIPGVNILDHLYQEPFNSEDTFSNFKVIVNPRTVFTTSVHGVLSSEKNCVWVDRKTARMYHTRAQKQSDLTPDQLVYDDRLLSYSARLTPAVTAALRQSGLLPEDSSN